MSWPSDTAVTGIRLLSMHFVGILLLTAACAPAAPPAPAQPTAPPATVKPAAQPTSKPAGQAAEKPVAKPTEQPAAKPAVKTEAPAKPEPAAKPAGPAYYQGKAINLLIGTTPGGGPDIPARIIARHLPRHIPGSPSVVPQNMGGGGGLLVMNHLYNVAPRDGSVMAMPTGGVYMVNVFGLEGIQHKLDEMIPLYNPEGTGAIIYVSSKLGIKDPKDITKVTQPLHYGVSTPEGNSVLLGIAGFKMLGVPVNPVRGYPGSAEIRLAVERGELDAGWESSGGYAPNLKPMIDRGVVVPLFQSGLWRPEDNSIVKIPGLDHIPTFEELHRAVKGSEPSGPLWDAWLLPLVSYGRYTIFLPPGVPEQAVRELTVGLEGACKDPAFIADFEKILADPKCYLGEQARLITQRSSQADPAALEALKSIRPTG